MKRMRNQDSMISGDVSIVTLSNRYISAYIDMYLHCRQFATEIHPILRFRRRFVSAISGTTSSGDDFGRRFRLGLPVTCDGCLREASGWGLPAGGFRLPARASGLVHTVNIIQPTEFLNFYCL